MKLDKYVCSIARPVNKDNQHQQHAGFMGMRIVVMPDDRVFVWKQPHVFGIDNPVALGGIWEEFRIEKRFGETTETWLERMGAKRASFKAEPQDLE
jgi:hypothetical protein